MCRKKTNSLSRRNLPRTNETLNRKEKAMESKLYCIKNPSPLTIKDEIVEVLDVLEDVYKCPACFMALPEERSKALDKIMETYAKNRTQLLRRKTAEDSADKK
jgi:hypothetical protein